MHKHRGRARAVVLAALLGVWGPFTAQAWYRYSIASQGYTDSYASELANALVTLANCVAFIVTPLCLAGLLLGGASLMGVRRPGWRDLMLGVPVGVSGLAVLYGVRLALNESGLSIWLNSAIPSAAGGGLDGMHGDHLFAMHLVLGVVAEELFFRGFLVGVARTIWGASPAVWGAAVLFGLPHFDQGGAAVVSCGVLGVVFGYWFLTLKSIFPLMLGHGIVLLFAVWARQ